MNKDWLVTKRNGRSEPINLEKIHQVVQWAATGLPNVSVSQVELTARIQFYDGIKTETIHEMLVKSAADLISEETDNYQYLAARLAVFQIRKEAFGTFQPPNFYAHVKRLVALGKYDSTILQLYSPEEFEQMDGFLRHERDLSFSYAAVKQLQGKYLVQDRVTGELFESPQILYLMIAATLFSGYPSSNRLDWVKRFYEAISTFKLSLPTPIMAGVRTPTRQFSSCVLIECNDSLRSINATACAIVDYVSRRAGIGVNVGRLRGVGSTIRSGEAFHTGLIPFIKYFQSAVKCCSQGGIRGGAATFFYPLWHWECEDLLVLKNNRGIDENRARHVDYGVQLNQLMYQRLIAGGNITLFSPAQTPGLYEAFFESTERFKALYEAYEENPAIPKRTLRAVDLFSLLMQERASTGRIYIQNVDHCNEHGAFDPTVAPIRQSNLCMEISLPTQPLSAPCSDEGEIALCTLAGFNLGTLEHLEELEELSELIVRALDALLDFQTYPLEQAQTAALKRRSLGIGVVNFAYYLAKNGKRYSDGSAKFLTHRLFEAIQYYLLKASCVLASEKGPCEWFHQTRYAKGILPIDTYKKSLDKICSAPLERDWERLRANIQRYGLRHSTLTALMPSETSSQISNATNGIEPPRGYVSVKASKDGVLKQVVPEFNRLKHHYELLWSLPNNQGYLELVAIMQKFVDQSISANTAYDPSLFPDAKIPMKQLLRDLLHAYQLGIKTLYYHNTRDGMKDPNTPIASSAVGCSTGACSL